MKQLTRIFKMLGHPGRLSIVLALYNNGELNVGEIQRITGMPQATVSQQLTKLREANIVASRRDEARMYYKLNNELVRKIIKVVNKE